MTYIFKYLKKHVILFGLIFLLSLFIFSISLFSFLPSGSYVSCDIIPIFGTFYKESCCINKSISINIDNAGWVLVSTSSTGNDGYWTNTSITNSASGGHSISARIEDSCNDNSIITSTFTIISATRDITIQSPTSTSYQNCFNIPITGSFYRETCCSNKTITYRIDGNSWSIVTYSASTDVGIWTNSSVFFSNGVHTIAAYILDSCLGTRQSSTISFSILSGTADITIGSPSTTSYPVCSNIYLYGTYVKQSCCSVNTIQYSLDGATWVNVDSIDNSTVNGFWTNSQISPTAGGHTIYVKYSDSCNASDATTAITFTMLSSPRVDLIIPVTNSSYCNPIIISGSYTNESCCTTKTITYSIDGSATWLAVSSVDSGLISGYWTNVSATIASGQHTIRAKILNSCGISYTSASITFTTLPSTTPLITLASPIGTTYNMGTIIPVYGSYSNYSCCNNKTIDYRLYDGSWSSWVAVSSQGTGYLSPWTHSTLTFTNSGVRSVQVRLSDSCGTSMVTQLFTIGGCYPPKITDLTVTPATATCSNTDVIITGTFWVDPTTSCCTNACLQYLIDAGSWTDFPPEAASICFGFEGSMGEAVSVIEGACTQDTGWILNGSSSCTSTNAHSGSGWIWNDDNNCSTGTESSWLVLPSIPATTTTLLSFWYKGNSGYTSPWEIYTSTTCGTPPTGFTVNSTVTKPTTSCAWYQTTGISLASFAGSNVCVAFRHTGDYTDEWYLDDICFSNTAGATYCPTGTTSGSWNLHINPSGYTDGVHTVSLRIISTCTSGTLSGSDFATFTYTCCDNPTLSIINPNPASCPTYNVTGNYFEDIACCPAGTIDYRFVNNTCAASSCNVSLAGSWESAHPYIASTNNLIVETSNSAACQYCILFDTAGSVEASYDELKIYTYNGSAWVESASYYNTFQGQSLCFLGSGVRIQIEADGSTQYWGARVLGISYRTTGCPSSWNGVSSKASGNWAINNLSSSSVGTLQVRYTDTCGHQISTTATVTDPKTPPTEGIIDPDPILCPTYTLSGTYTSNSTCCPGGTTVEYKFPSLSCDPSSCTTSVAGSPWDSPHPYPNSAVTQVLQTSNSSACKYCLTFDVACSVENTYDEIRIDVFDGTSWIANGGGVYYNTLADTTICVNGKGVRVSIDADSSTNAWGVRINAAAYNTTGCGPTSWTGVSSMSGGNWVVNNLLSNYNGTVQVRVTDSCGTQSTYETITDPRAQPNVWIIDPTVTCPVNYNIFGTFTHDNSCCGAATVRYSINGTTTWTGVTSVNASGWWTQTGITTGAGTIRVRINDTCGVRTKNITIPVPPVALSMISPTSNVYPCVGYSIPLNGTFLTGTNCTIQCMSWSTAPMTTCASGTAISNVTGSSGAGSWNYGNITSGLTGTSTPTIYVYMVLTNGQTASDSQMVTLGVTGDISSFTVGQVYNTCPLNIPLYGTFVACPGCSPTTIQYRIYEAQSWQSWVTITTMNVSSTNGYWSGAPFDGLTPFNHTIQIQFTNSCGVTNTASSWLDVQAGVQFLLDWCSTDGGSCDLDTHAFFPISSTARSYVYFSHKTEYCITGSSMVALDRDTTSYYPCGSSALTEHLDISCEALACMCSSSNPNRIINYGVLHYATSTCNPDTTVTLKVNGTNVAVMSKNNWTGGSCTISGLSCATGSGKELWHIGTIDPCNINSSFVSANCSDCQVGSPTEWPVTCSASGTPCSGSVVNDTASNDTCPGSYTDLGSTQPIRISGSITNGANLYCPGGLGTTNNWKPNSPHDYSNSQTCTSTEVSRTIAGATAMCLCFNGSFSFESIDKLFVKDSTGTIIGTYSGTSLADQCLCVNGNTVSLCYYSDSSVVYYGYDVTQTTYKTSGSCGGTVDSLDYYRFRADTTGTYFIRITPSTCSNTYLLYDLTQSCATSTLLTGTAFCGSSTCLTTTLTSNQYYYLKLSGTGVSATYGVCIDR